MDWSVSPHFSCNTCPIIKREKCHYSLVSYAARPLSSSTGFLGDNDVVTQAIHDAQQLLRSHSNGTRERDRDRDSSGKMVSVHLSVYSRSLLVGIGTSFWARRHFSFCPWGSISLWVYLVRRVKVTGSLTGVMHYGLSHKQTPRLIDDTVLQKLFGNDKEVWHLRFPFLVPSKQLFVQYPLSDSRTMTRKSTYEVGDQH